LEHRGEFPGEPGQGFHLRACGRQPARGLALPA
jgi:hypothetical protein